MKTEHSYNRVFSLVDVWDSKREILKSVRILVEAGISKEQTLEILDRWIGEYEEWAKKGSEVQNDEAS